MSIGDPQPKGWSRDRMTKTHRKGKRRSKRDAARQRRLRDVQELKKSEG